MRQKHLTKVEAEVEIIGLRRWAGYGWSHRERGLQPFALSFELIRLRRAYSLQLSAYGFPDSGSAAKVAAHNSYSAAL